MDSSEKPKTDAETPAPKEERKEESRHSDAMPPMRTPGESIFSTRFSKPSSVPSVPRDKHHSPHPRRMRIIGVAFFFLLSASCGYLGGWLGNRDNNTADTAAKQQVVLKSQSQLISSIAQNVGQSVVSVDTTTTTAASSSSGYFDFSGLGGDTTQESAGTGVIISSDGLILTNRHVVPSGTTSVSVTLSDGTTYDNVQVVGRTSESDSLDIAFLKIQDTKGKKLVPASIGDSSKVKVGDSVIAIGNALGQYQNTVTSGIISGYGRSVQASDESGSSSENLEDLFQTDAAINSGNSGGPLVNLNGEVIGINTAVASTAQSIGFAIPMNDITGLIKSVEQTGKLERPYLGVVYVALTSDIAKQYNLSAQTGAYIPQSSQVGQDSVPSGGPADKAGVKAGDIITKVDGTAVDQTHSLTSLLDKHAVGDKITLTINRSGKTITIDVTLGAAPTGS